MDNLDGVNLSELRLPETAISRRVLVAFLVSLSSKHPLSVLAKVPPGDEARNLALPSK